MKKLGVIGGLGTDTAAQFYVATEKMWHASGQPNHIPFVLENTQSPFALEQVLTQNVARIDELRHYLCQAARFLEQSGATLVVLPCNTAHVHIEAVRAALRVPVLSITEEVARELKRGGVRRAAILGTRVTRESGIYTAALDREAIKAHYPSQEDQRRIERIIGRTLAWKNDATDTQALRRVIGQVRTEGADAVVLACTDLQLCLPREPMARVYDSMHILAQASVRALLAQ